MRTTILGAVLVLLVSSCAGFFNGYLSSGISDPPDDAFEDASPEPGIKIKPSWKSDIGLQAI